jgi:subtilisin family serine protease
MRQRYYVAPPRSVGPPPGTGLGRTRHEMQFSGVPPRGETRFVPSEVVVQMPSTVQRAQVEAVAQQLGITMVASQNLNGSGRTIYQFRSASGADVSDVIRRLEQNNIVASAQPNYVFRLNQAQPAALPREEPVQKENADRAPLPAGDQTQYMIDKLGLTEIHKETRGRDVSIAVIDSEVDGKHPDLQPAIKERYAPAGGASTPHTHGTGMAGAIVSKYKLLGVAPEANVFAIKVFDEKNASAEATSFQILQGLDHAIQKGVRIINMSFAGPYDVMLERKLKEAHDKGIILVAAAGNAGPKSPPLYPAADPNVIAVTAVDMNDQPFKMANQGKHVAIAAPGVDILVPSPNDAYQLTTGTSVATAHVSGVIALMLEKRPDLSPDDVRAILASTAKPLPGTRPVQTGAGLINPAQAMDYEPVAPAAPVAAQQPKTAAR